MSRTNAARSAQVELPISAAPAPQAEDLANQARRLCKDELMPAFQAAVTRMQPKVIAPLLDTSPSYLSDAIAGTDRKSVKLEWFIVLLLTAPDSAKHELVTILNRIAGYKAPERARDLTPEEEFRIWRAAIGRMAPGVIDAIKAEVDAHR